MVFNKKVSLQIGNKTNKYLVHKYMQTSPTP